MSREVRRVPLDFQWPLNKVWEGYEWPDRFNEESCPDCELGYTPEAQRFYDQWWYGKVPFDPASTGSTPFLPEGPEAQRWAKRQIEREPGFYGTGELAIAREAKRITDLWNSGWGHHLSQEDVDALVEAEQLHDFTHEFISGQGWVKREDAPHPTAAEVNSWGLFGLGLGSSAAFTCVAARAEREGVQLFCPTCKGHGSIESYPGQREEAESWEHSDPPQGEGWQLWETTSEGSPVTPVFESAEDLGAYLYAHPGIFGPGWKVRDEASVISWVQGDGWIPSGVFPEEKAVIQ